MHQIVLFQVSNGQQVKVLESCESKQIVSMDFSAGSVQVRVHGEQ